ncbi:MAG: hypothetical protein U9R56_00730 [candidate division Zixibacteria bacterium]|nr:hypothetical protein [candidate division Zixibacteria bacterium]
MVVKSGRISPVDLSNVKRYSYVERTNKAGIRDFGHPVKKVKGSDFFESLPAFLKAADLREFISRVVRARRRGKPFQLLLGAHSIKIGLSPVIADLVNRDIVTGLSFNGAGLIHDLEVAFFGATSEDVQEGLEDGSFGMVRETAEMYAAIGSLAIKKKIGLGEAAGLFINGEKARHRRFSLFGCAAKCKRPVTIHVGVGTDIVAQHPDYDAAAIGAASHIDFRILCRICAAADNGGVVANIGSAVILPEVFLKALTVARNLSKGKSRLTTANFDMIHQYRPMENVVSRPIRSAGKGYNFTGHHEIMIPLLAWGLRLEQGRKRS